MLKVGITGGIGSGKTTVCRIFETLGIPVFYADEESKKILASDASVIAEVKKLLGADVYEENIPNRKKIAAIVFQDETKRNALNALLHPKVFTKWNEWIEKQTAPYVLDEAALIYEAGLDKMLDEVIAVSAPEPLRIKRTLQRTSVSENEIRARMKFQLPEDEKLKRASFIIYNDEAHPVIEQVLKLHERLIQKNR